MNFKFIDLSNDLPLAVRIKRAAFAMTMVTVIGLGGALLALAISEIPANRIKANEMAVNVIGEVISGDIRNQFGNLRQLSLSSLAWTALTDSAGRDAYMKPFLRSREQEEGSMPIQLLDYRGRPIVGSFPPGVDQIRFGRLVNDVLAFKRPQFFVTDNGGRALLVAAYPVEFPYSQDAIGALAGAVDLSRMVKARSAGLGDAVAIELVYQEGMFDVRPHESESRYFPAQFTLHFGDGIDGQPPIIQLHSNENPWLSPILKGISLSALFAVLLGGLVWWVAGVLAQRTTRRLILLANSCNDIARGTASTLPDDSAKDEIGVLTRTLRQAVEGYEQIQEHLEERIADKTRALAESETRFRNFFENSTSIMLLINPASGDIIAANRSAVQFYGHPREHLLTMRIGDINHLAPEDVLAEAQNSLLEDRDYYLFSHKLDSGEIRDTEVYFTPVESNGQTLLFSVVHDITERKRAEEKLVLAANVFTHAREGIMITTGDGTIVDVNDAFSQITGYGREEVIGYNPRLLKSGRHDSDFYEALWSTLVKKGSWSGELWNRRKGGEVYPEMITISAVNDALGNVRQYVALFSDITTLKAHEHQLEQQAHFDVLTQLPNRLLLNDRLNQAMSQTQRRGLKLAVVFVDLDGFKEINDVYGHAVGDMLLVTLASRMRQALRESDTLARLGGDEFVAILLEFANGDESFPILERLRAAAALPITVGNREIQVSASVGVTFFPQNDFVVADQLLRQADQAMYQAKIAGKNRYHVFVDG